MSEKNAYGIDWKKLAEYVKQANSILLISHIRPDGDAIGSQIALGRALSDLGKKVHLVNADPVPRNLRFLDPDGMIVPLAELSPEQKADLNQIDLILVLDTSSWAQLGAMGDWIKTASVRKTVLDHHVKGDDIGAEKFIGSDAEAAGSLVFHLIEELGLPMKFEYAWPLFTAISTDTGWFRFSSVSADTYRMAAALIDAGVRPDEQYKIIYEQETFGRAKLIAAALSNMEQFLDGEGIFTWLSSEDFERSGAIPSESEDIVNITLKVGGSRVALIMVEQKSGGYKLSFRSRCDLDCSLLAGKFGGGGHKKAAGAFINAPFAEARKILIDSTVEMMNSLK
ncbi:MAG: DHH family phosphoesterase [Planctomycetia bacterium]|nr:DHH family phosphoesterase [Planctomycetia bacterium]